jgi:hypothetical protein
MEKLSRGICRLSIVPVRHNASDKSEMVTQLLFGDHYTVNEISKDKKWFKITIEFDNYQGWIDVKQHTGITEEYFEHLNNTEFKIATDITSTILYKKQLIQIVIGSILPISSYELFEVSEQFAFNGASKNMGQKQGYEYLKQIATSYLNTPYLWGGKTPFGIDCSGFTQQIFKLCGYKLKRDSSQQFLIGEKIDALEDAKPGDLAFFENDNNKINHVGIIMEERGIIHASGFVRKDILDKKGIYNKELSAYTHKLAGIRRIFKA